MKLIPASYEILECPQNAALCVEKAARTCYKSEDRIEPGSAEKLARRLIDSGHEAMVEFGGWIVVKFISNRGFTHETVRHRLCSLAQESTRYCNYSKGKFREEITCIDPEWVLARKIADPVVRAQVKAEFVASWMQAEAAYMHLIERGVPAELARDVLPIGLKAEIVVGANVREWRHILKLRTSARAHPRMREVMVPLLRDLRERVPVLFDDIEVPT